MVSLMLSQELLIIIVVAIIAVILIIITALWAGATKSTNSVKLMEQEIELRKIAMVEKDLESKRLLENALPLPKEQQEYLAQIRSSTSEQMNKIGYLHSEISERLANLEAQAEYKKLEKMLAEIKQKEKKLQKK